MSKLGNGLILRTIKESDKDSLTELARHCFPKEDMGKGIALYVNQLFDYFPSFSLQDNFIIVDTANNDEVVSWVNLNRKVCVFENIKIPYGSVDFVGSHKDYRNRGLVRHLFLSLEERALEHNLAFIVILGIPYFYKTFGYEYGVKLEGYLHFSEETPIIVPEKKNKSLEFTIQKVEDNSAFKSYLQIRAKRNQHLNLYQEIHPSSFAFYNTPHLADCDEARDFYLVKNKDDLIVGNFYLMVRFGFLSVRELYVEDIEAISSILNLALEHSRKYKIPIEILKPAQQHVLLSLEKLIGSPFSNGYAWYVKIPSIQSYLQQITPILEKRLIASPHKNYTGNLTINYYRGGLRLNFIEGKLSSINEQSISELQDSNRIFDLQIPPNNLIQLLMGMKSIDSLKSESYDISFEENRKSLLNILFPLIRAGLTPAI